MAFSGWLSFAGVEIANSSRTAAYVATLMPTLDFTDAWEGDLAVALGDKEYASPVLDEAEWFDVDHPDTWEFAGFYPLSVTGLTDSTRDATVTQSTTAGGMVSGVRRATREIRAMGLLVGTDRAACEAGMTWLKAALNGDQCRPIGCTGDELCFMTECPNLDDCLTDLAREEIMARYMRHLHKVTCVAGPTVVEEMLLTAGYLMKVELTLVADVPHIYGDMVPIATADGAFLQTQHPDSLIYPLVSSPALCPAAPAVPVVQDPDCPAVPAPPRPPVIVTDCGVVPAAFYSYAIFVPDSALTTWQDSVMYLTIKTGASAARHVRVRLLPRPLPTQEPSDLDPCSACSSFVVTYLPANSTITIDGCTEEVTLVTANGKASPASHLLSGTNGLFTWPLFTCGSGYFVIVDVDVANVVYLALSIGTRE